MVMTLQSHVNSYHDLDEDYLPPHLRLHGLANSIHQNAQARMRDIVTPRVLRIDGHHDLIQGLPCINKVGRDNRPRAWFCDGNDGFGDSIHGGTPWEQQDHPPCEHNHNGYDRACPHSRNQGCLAHPDRNRCPFLPNVQCAARKKVGHVAKHCDMLATAIYLERYMKHDLSTNVHSPLSAIGSNVGNINLVTLMQPHARSYAPMWRNWISPWCASMMQWSGTAGLAMTLTTMMSLVTHWLD